MHLRDRRRPERPRVELAEHLERRAAERALELGQEVVERDRRDLALQLLELGDPGRREEVDPRRHHLAELDERRPELLEREPHALRRLEADRLDLRAPAEDLAGALEDVGDADPADEVAEAVPDEDRGDLVQAREVPHHPDGLAQHHLALSGLSFFSAEARSASASPPRMPLATAANARAELARRLDPGDRRVGRSGRELLREVAHRQRDLLAGLGAGLARGAQRLAQLRLHLRARRVGDLSDGGEEVVLELAAGSRARS